MKKLIDLNGLVGSNPLGALAAFGLLKVLNENGLEATLQWAQHDDWIAQLHCDLESPAALSDWLRDWFADRSSTDLNWSADDIRVAQHEYRNALAQALLTDPALATMLQAQAADGAVDDSKGLIKPTAFYMVSGQQSFLDNMRAVRLALEQNEALWNEALIGPWTYATRLHSLGWDPASERLHALRARAPASEKASCVAGAVWLAYEALALLPCISINAKARTTGFFKRHWHWPIHDVPVGADSLRVLLQSDPAQARTGIVSWYASERFSFGQGYGVFRPATPL